MKNEFKPSTLMGWVARPDGVFRINSDLYVEPGEEGTIYIRSDSRPRVEHLAHDVCRSLLIIGSNDDLRQCLTDIYEQPWAEAE